MFCVLHIDPAAEMAAALVLEWQIRHIVLHVRKLVVLK